MQRVKMFTLYKFLLLVFVTLGVAFIGLVILPKTLVRYKCPSFSGVVLDDYTGKPIEGAKIEISWSALRPKGWHGSDLMDLHVAMAITDKHGIYTIPAWESEAAREWIYYEFNPSISIVRPGIK